MFKQIFVVFGVLGICYAAKETAVKPTEYVFEDPFAVFDKHFSHALAHHYLWPWSQLMKAAAALDEEENLEEPQIVRSPDKFQVFLNVKRFKPEELKIKVKNGQILVEGRHKEANEKYQHFIANHFTQRFVLPAGTKSEEVSATLNEKGILIISAPKHPLPPPPPEREVPIIVTTKAVEESTTLKQEPTTENKVEENSTSPSTPIEDLELVEATTHLGKIRKKELKNTTKTNKDNEVSKVIDGNGLDYAMDYGIQDVGN